MYLILRIQDFPSLLDEGEMEKEGPVIVGLQYV